MSETFRSGSICKIFEYGNDLGGSDETVITRFSILHYGLQLATCSEGLLLKL
jgi:hypothetical protein